MSVAALERKKYEDVWSIPSYSAHSPGLENIPFFLKIARPKTGASIIDIGAGAGAASAELKKQGFNVTGFDLTDKAWKHLDIPIITGCVWDRFSISDAYFDHAYCCDMMEHIPECFVGLAISNILDHARNAFFSISFMPDAFGAYIGESLHLTVKPFTWWRDLFYNLGVLCDARDRIGEGIFYVQR